MIKREVSVFHAVCSTPTPSPGLLFRHTIRDRISGNVTSLVCVTTTPFLFLHYSLNNSIPFPPFQHSFLLRYFLFSSFPLYLSYVCLFPSFLTYTFPSPFNFPPYHHVSTSPQIPLRSYLNYKSKSPINSLPPPPHPPKNRLKQLFLF